MINNINQINDGKVAPITADQGSGGTPQVPPKKPSSFQKMDVTSHNAVEIIPRFVVVKRKDGDFSRLSPFVIDRVLSNCIGSVKSVKKIKDGLLIETSNAAQSRKLLSLKTFHEFEVETTPHSSLNYTKGVITCRDLLNCSLAEIEEHMQSEGVINVKRITIKRNGNFDTASLILTFNRLSLPQKVKAGIHVLHVRPYIPAPLRCFRCQRFGHTSTRCQESEICVCGRQRHDGSQCEEPITCVNCGGSHSARSRNCHIFKEEVAIQGLKTMERLSYPEAKRKFKESLPSMPVTYAQAAKSTTNVKDIVREMIPEIVEVCRSILQGNVPTAKAIQNLEPSSSQGGDPLFTAATIKSSSAANTNEPRERTASLNEKRKRSPSDNDPSGSERNSSASQSEEQEKRKPGRSRGKKGKKP